MSLKKIMSKIEQELKERENIKDELYDAMRKATRFSKQAIFLVHKGRLKEAKKLLSKTKKLFTKLNEIAEVHRKLVYAGIVDSAFQEYAEAHVFLRLVQDNRFVGPKKISVPSTSFLLGLADVLGELRRRALDSLRKGDVKAAEKSLETMELIYSEFMAMDEALRVVSELRRKSDIARRIIEATRGDVTIEVRRSSLECSIKKLEKALKTEK
jgi:translin